MTGFRWMARIVGGLLAALMLVIVLGHAFSNEGLPNPFRQPPGVALELLGMFLGWIGLIIAWKWEGTGGMLVIVCTVIFQIVEGRIWIGWVFGLLELIGIMFVLSRLLRRFQKTD